MLGIGLAACSSSGPARSSGSTNSPGTTRSTPVEAVLLAAQHGISDRTARFTMSISATGSAAFSESGNGSVDFSNQSAQIAMTVSVLSEQLHVTVVEVGGAVYEKLAGVPGLSSVLRPGKSWIEVPIGSSSAATDGLGSEGNPASFLLALTRKGLVVTRVASSSVDGVQATEYGVKFPDDIAKLGAGAGSLPSSVQQSLRGATMHVWIDGSGLLRRIAMGIAEPDVGTVMFTIDLQDYGVPVTVSPPPASEVESLQSVRGQLGVSTTTSGYSSTS